eukprot:NODE_11257_length_556_cov_61.886836_g10974_i0.p1 GENE.NODE_11257_length_556_cov_61.886836_g10974_i0~~NODE_11257_length_556_cov_61.886836_g10974_i0.p1  ORF type:complete len:132 (-),score=1.63 NODE_11257_length_556_cov_61.886836_g10974_i0:71-466(-)
MQVFPFVALSWHAQHAISKGQANKESYDRRFAFMSNFTRFLRERLGRRLVFVHSSELHQLRLNGTSVIQWPRSVVFRHYQTCDREVNLRQYFTTGVNVRVTDLSTRQESILSAGGAITLQPAHSYRVVAIT